MAKTSNNNITSMLDDWGNDPRNGLPYSGQAIQMFLKETLNTKPAAFYFNPAESILYGFVSEDDKNEYLADMSLTNLIISRTPIQFTSDMYRIFRLNKAGNNINATTNQKEINLDVEFEVQTKLISESSWNPTMQGCYFTLYVDSGVTGTYKQVEETVLVPSGLRYLVNVKEYLKTGNNRVKLVMVAEDNDTVTATDVYTINVSEIYIEPYNNGWYNAIVEGVDANYQLGGFRIVGSLSKTLCIEIYSGNERMLSFEKLIGLTSYVDTPYYFNAIEGLDLSSLPTGVFICKAWVESGTVQSLPINYNFMHVAAADIDTAQLVVVNNVADKVYNYSTAKLCDYAIYDLNQSYGNPHIKIQLWSGTTPTTKIDNDYPNTSVGESHSLEFTIEWLIESTIDLYTYFEITIGTSQQVRSLPIDNSAVYPAETGASFYINATTRSNNDIDRELIINEATNPNSTMEVEWLNMSFVDGIDGWTTDDKGRKCLLIPALSRLIIPRKIFPGANSTVELCYQIKNVSDYNENCITAAINPNDEGFNGLRIRPTQIMQHSPEDTNSSNDDNRCTDVEDETIVHYLGTILSNFAGNSGRNLYTGYVNGNKRYLFEYSSTTSWNIDAPIVIGSDTADTYFYFIRCYDKVIGVKSAEQNYINSLYTLNERRSEYDKINSILNEATHEIDYDKVKNSDEYNFFVVEMKGSQTIPSRANGWSKSSTGRSNLEMHYAKNHKWDFKIFDTETSGQGTTSMDYYLWNLRWRIDKTNKDTKKVAVAYYDTPTYDLAGNMTFNIQPSVESKTVFFDGGANGTPQQHPAVKRITAKINFASSPQSNKMGMTMGFNDIRNYLRCYNEAQQMAIDNEEPVPTVAVYQYPAFGFSKRVSAQGVETYEFIGLFTIGPDKGDKPTFGFDKVEDTLISMEGVDHSKKLAKFSVPWDEVVTYLASDEALGVKLPQNNFDASFEVGACYGISTDDNTKASQVLAKLTEEFKPAYDAIYNNSVMIFELKLNDERWGGDNSTEIINRINSNIPLFQATAYDNRFLYADMEFFIEGEYILYHFNSELNKYIAGVNLIEESRAISNNIPYLEQFKQFRINRFREQFPVYWDVQDNFVKLDYDIITGASDNLVKNFYPYKMKSFDDGGKYRQRVDDYDTMGKKDNKGANNKPYYVELLDAINNSLWFGGANSVFVNNILAAFWEDWTDKDNISHKGLRSIGGDVMEAMAWLGGGANLFEGCMAFFKKYFWDNAQNYFPRSAYNIDAAIKYEAAWLANGQAVPPLTQSNGSELELQMLWFKQRIIYCMSLFKVGPFNQYNDTTLGTISFRPQSFTNPEVTPVMDMYPAFIAGQNGAAPTERTKANTPAVFEGIFGTDGQTTCYYQATNYLSSIGDLKNLVLGQQYISPINIYGAKLRTFKMGDENPSLVTTNVPGLTFNNTKCLETVDLRNASSLIGSMSFDVCTRLQELFAEGTSLSSISLPNGSKIKKLHLPDSTQVLVLRNLKYLTEFNMPEDLSNINVLQIENCTHQDPMDYLVQITDTENNNLRYIRLIWQGIKEIPSNDFNIFAQIGDGIDEGKYKGINTQGGIDDSLNPVIEGTISINGNGPYEDRLTSIGVNFDNLRPYDEDRVIGQGSKFGALRVIYNPNNIYIKFADPEVLRVLLANNIGDGVGITLQNASDTLSLPNNNNEISFYLNKNIESFEELAYFGITNIPQYCFKTSSIKLIRLPETVNKIDIEAFRESDIETINIPANVINILSDAFTSCNSLSRVDITDLSAWCGIVFSNNYSNPLYYAHDLYLNDVKIEHLRMPDDITEIKEYTFKGSSIKTLDANNVTVFRNASFEGCDNLQSVRIKGNNITLYNSVFRHCSNLSAVQIDGEITTTIEYGFADCSSLSNIDISKFRAIGNSYFLNCTSLTVADCSNATTIGSAAFLGCINLEKVILPDNLTTIADNCFRRCMKLSSIDIPNSVTSIGNASFYECKALTQITIPNSVQTIDRLCFQYAGLKDVVIGNGVTSIDSVAFMNCPIEKLTIGAGLSQIGIDWLATNKLKDLTLRTLNSDVLGYFENNNSVEKLTIGDSVSASNISSTLKSIFANVKELRLSCGSGSVADNKLNHLDNLEKVVIDGNIIYLGLESFAGNNNLKEVYLLNDSLTDTRDSVFVDCFINKVVVNSIEHWLNIHWGDVESNPAAISQSLYIGDEEESELLTELTVPDNITSIKPYAFTNNKQLISVNLGSVTSIGASAFSGTNIESLVISNSVIEINDGVFGNCSLLTDVIIGDGLDIIDSGVFINDTRLKNITIGSSVTSIINNAFTNCPIETLTLRTLNENVRNYFKAFNTIKNLVIDGNIQVIDNASFKDWSQLESVILNEGITTINYNSFYNCTSLKNVKFPSTLIRVDNNVFYRDNNIERVDIPSLEQWLTIYFGNEAANPMSNSNARLYVNNELLENLVIPESVTLLSYYSLIDFRQLLTIDIHSRVSILGSFKNCNFNKVNIHRLASWCNINLQSYECNPLACGNGELYLNNERLVDIIIPEGATLINSRVFYLANINSVTLPNSIIAINLQAFYSSTLTTVDIPNSIKNSYNSAFGNCRNLIKVNIHDLASWCNINFSNAESNPLYAGNGNLYLNDTLINELTVPDVDTIKQAVFTHINVDRIKIGNVTTTIRNIAFYKSSVGGLSIGSSVTSIGENAFAGCRELTALTCYAMQAPAIQENTFGNDSDGYAGSNRYGEKWLVVYPDATGYDEGYWADVLLNEDKCGFTLGLGYIIPKLTGIDTDLISPGATIVTASFEGQGLQDYTLDWSIEEPSEGTSSVSCVTLGGVTNETCVLNVDNGYIEGSIKLVCTIKDLKGVAHGTVEKNIMVMDPPRVIIQNYDESDTETYNPEMLAVCYALGWCESENEMYNYEARLVTDIGLAFLNFLGLNLLPLKYFNFNTLLSEAFYSPKNTLSIGLPSSITLVNDSSGKGLYPRDRVVSLYFNTLENFYNSTLKSDSALSYKYTSIYIQNELLTKYIYQTEKIGFICADVCIIKVLYIASKKNNPLPCKTAVVTKDVRGAVFWGGPRILNIVYLSNYLPNYTAPNLGGNTGSLVYSLGNNHPIETRTVYMHKGTKMYTEDSNGYIDIIENGGFHIEYLEDQTPEKLEELGVADLVEFDSE